MATGTLQKRLGHRDHNRELTYEEFMAAAYEEGYKYELIEGRLYASPFPNFPHDRMVRYLNVELAYYHRMHPDIIAEPSSGARVFVSATEKTTCPQPDFALYQHIPSSWDAKWQDISPLIVIEVVSPDNADKDYIRNVELYQQVPSIREYWIFDRLGKDNGPILRVYHRTTARQKWKIAEYGPRDTYATDLLPGITLPVCPPK